MVINYDVPHDSEDYVHRIGRTARADRDGEAITLVNEDDMYRFAQIEKFIDKSVEKLPLPEALGEGPEYAPQRHSAPRGKGRGGKHGGKSKSGGKHWQKAKSKKKHSKTKKSEQ